MCVFVFCICFFKFSYNTSFLFFNSLRYYFPVLTCPWRIFERSIISQKTCFLISQWHGLLWEQQCCPRRDFYTHTLKKVIFMYYGTKDYCIYFSHNSWSMLFIKLVKKWKLIIFAYYRIGTIIEVHLKGKIIWSSFLCYFNGSWLKCFTIITNVF
jgi:hypothetical protein